MTVNKDIALVLTGTIVPTTRYSKYRDWKVRRLEYLKALNYYSQYGKIYFLENSGYDIESDEAFTSIPNVNYRKFPRDENDRHAIGYQEFKMLDDWILNEKNPPQSWIKLSGRYIIENFPEILEQVRQTDKNLLMDINVDKKWADTYLFYITSNFYKEHFLHKYVYCTPYLCIEEILYKYLLYYRLFREVNFFLSEPIYAVVSSNGRKSNHGKSPMDRMYRNIWRKINFKIYPSRLVFFPPFYATVHKIRRAIEIKFMDG
ncbi:MAG TPA: hypothetical protein OIM03_10105 [Veillonellaceae bacterium]|nr:hypothetical protein [Veillonellaceae bacterium]